MRLIMIRHGIAEDAEAFAKTGGEDAQRPLTDKGRRRMRRIARGLRAVAKDLDVLGTSPLIRAAETASIVADRFRGVEPVEVDPLIPGGDRDDVLEWLREQGEEETVAIVGHEPDLGLLASWLLATPLNHFIEFGKGGACCLAWPSRPSDGNAWLRWALTPSQLRTLGTLG